MIAKAVAAAALSTQLSGMPEESKPETWDAGLIGIPTENQKLHPC
jgi:hypothetical protein